MKYRLIISFVTLIISFSSTAQTFILKGNVRDAHGQSISDADVFVSNTSIHANSDAQGNFSLADVGANQPFTLVVSRVGYKTFFKNFSSQSALKFQQIVLVSNDTLQDVTVASSKLERWNKWKKIFIETFIGTGEFAHQCKILNPEVLKIHFNKETNTLTVHSAKPLQIRNKALGYLVYYALTNYQYDTLHFSFKFSGYPYFQQLERKKKDINRWNKNRKIAYQGSVMQFVREVYNDSLKEEDFTVINPNPKRKKVSYKEWQSIISKRFSGKTFTAKNPQDSMYVLVYDTLPVHQFCFVKDGVKYIQFTKPIEVVCNNLSAYAIEQKMKPMFLSKGKGSLISIDDNQPVSIWKDGSYFDPENNFMLQGLWAFTEKVSTMLPLDYVEENDKDL